jgi:hypothetical protein
MVYGVRDVALDRDHSALRARNGRPVAESRRHPLAARLPLGWLASKNGLDQRLCAAENIVSDLDALFEGLQIFGVRVIVGMEAEPEHQCGDGETVAGQIVAQFLPLRFAEDFGFGWESRKQRQLDIPESGI